MVLENTEMIPTEFSASTNGVKSDPLITCWTSTSIGCGIITGIWALISTYGLRVMNSAHLWFWMKRPTVLSLRECISYTHRPFRVVMSSEHHLHSVFRISPFKYHWKYSNTNLEVYCLIIGKSILEMYCLIVGKGVMLNIDCM